MSKIALLPGLAHDLRGPAEASGEYHQDILSVPLSTAACAPIPGLKKERTLDEHSGSR